MFVVAQDTRSENRIASYCRGRYYDPNAGRFLSEDPEVFLEGINFYAYVDNSPVQWADPFGLCKKKYGIKKPPTYDEKGTIHGPAEILVHAEFLDDEEHSPACRVVPAAHVRFEKGECFVEEFSVQRRLTSGKDAARS
jgi:RHS repeat-associated protein